MSETNIQNQKESFLKKEFFMLSWAAAVQHNRIWKNNPTQETKDGFLLNGKWITGTDVAINLYRKKSKKNQKKLKNFTKKKHLSCIYYIGGKNYVRFKYFFRFF